MCRIIQAIVASKVYYSCNLFDRVTLRMEELSIIELTVSGNLAVSNFRKMSLPTYEIQSKDYGYRKFNKKIYIMEQNL